jgi:hypothetical protein
MPGEEQEGPLTSLKLLLVPPYPEPDESSPQSPILCMEDPFQFYPLSLCPGFSKTFPLQILLQKNLFGCILHVPPILPSFISSFQ